MNSVFIKLTGNKDSHKILDGFEFWPDLTRHFGFTCPWAVKENVTSFSQSPLIRYLSNLQITKKGIKAQTSSNLGWVGLFTTELFILEYSYWLWNDVSIFSQPGAVAWSEACSLGMQAAPSSIRTSSTFFCGDLVMKTFLRPFSLFRWSKKSSTWGQRNRVVTTIFCKNHFFAYFDVSFIYTYPAKNCTL